MPATILLVACHRPIGGLPPSYWWTTTSVPFGAQLKSHLACEILMLMQPWLIGTPKLLCQ
jgi:hypothetical protein